MQSVAKRSVSFGNPLKCLLCYLLAFSLPLAALATAQWVVYPYRLAGTAPNVAQNLLTLRPNLVRWFPALEQAARDCAAPVAVTPEALRLVLANRDRLWLTFVAACALAAWVFSLLLPLLWRCRFHGAVNAARRTQAAIVSYRLRLGLIVLANLAMAFLVWQFGVRLIAGRTVWDWLAYFTPYALHPLAALAVFRLAAPSSLSGRHGFFKRI